MADRETRKDNPAASSEADRRAERLAQALRTNLKRRKDQARGRDAPPQEADHGADRVTGVEARDRPADIS